MSRSCLEDIITVDLLKATVLAGVSTLLEDGTEFDDSLWDRAIKYAIAHEESALDILMRERTILGERQEHTEDFDYNWIRFHTGRVPVQRVTGFRGNYGNITPIVYPEDWIQISSAYTGYLSLVPTATSPANGILGGQEGIRLELIYGAHSNVPDWYRYDYVAGFPCYKGSLTIPAGESEVSFEFPNGPLHADFEPEVFSISDANIVEVSNSNEAIVFGTADGDPVLVDTTFDYLIHTIPQDLIHVVLLRAAQLGLAVAGDLILGAGIAGFSRSMDGLVEAIQSTSSPTNSGYGARILQYEREASQIEAMLKAKFRGSSFFAL